MERASLTKSREEPSRSALAFSRQSKSTTAHWRDAPPSARRFPSKKRQTASSPSAVLSSTHKLSSHCSVSCLGNNRVLVRRDEIAARERRSTPADDPRHGTPGRGSSRRPPDCNQELDNRRSPGRIHHWAHHRGAGPVSHLPGSRGRTPALACDHYPGSGLVWMALDIAGSGDRDDRRFAPPITPRHTGPRHRAAG